jgi:hypothetical protein
MNSGNFRKQNEHIGLRRSVETQCVFCEAGGDTLRTQRASSSLSAVSPHGPRPTLRAISHSKNPLLGQPGS